MAKIHRITSGEVYRYTVRHGRRVSGKYLIAHAVFASSQTPRLAQGTGVWHNTDPGEVSRFGFILTRHVGKAVTRNRLRRQLKAITDQLVRDGFCGTDVVLRVRPCATDAGFWDLDRDVRTLVAKIKESAE